LETVREFVGKHWDHTLLRQQDPSGSRYGGCERVTKLKVTLGPTGALLDVHVEKSSGLVFLDDAAIAAFQQSQPLPGPPPGLAGGGGSIQFSMNFMVKGLNPSTDSTNDVASAPDAGTAKTADYFETIKKAVAQSWDPHTPLRKADPTGAIYRGRDRYTLLSISLEPEGTLRYVCVEKSSGVDFLDEAAIAAFTKSQPFPRPPAELVDKDNAVRFQFGFMLQFGDAPPRRLYRQN
jgi:TonB family protein